MLKLPPSFEQYDKTLSRAISLGDASTALVSALHLVKLCNKASIDALYPPYLNGASSSSCSSPWEAVGMRSAPNSRALQRAKNLLTLAQRYLDVVSDITQQQQQGGGGGKSPIEKLFSCWAFVVTQSHQGIVAFQSGRSRLALGYVENAVAKVLEAVSSSSSTTTTSTKSKTNNDNNENPVQTKSAFEFRHRSSSPNSMDDMTRHMISPYSSSYSPDPKNPINLNHNIDNNNNNNNAETITTKAKALFPPTFSSSNSKKNVRSSSSANQNNNRRSPSHTTTATTSSSKTTTSNNNNNNNNKNTNKLTSQQMLSLRPAATQLLHIMQGSTECSIQLIVLLLNNARILVSLQRYSVAREYAHLARQMLDDIQAISIAKATDAFAQIAINSNESQDWPSLLNGRTTLPLLQSFCAFTVGDVELVANPSSITSLRFAIQCLLEADATAEAVLGGVSNNNNNNNNPYRRLIAERHNVACDQLNVLSVIVEQQHHQHQHQNQQPSNNNQQNIDNQDEKQIIRSCLINRVRRSASASSSSSFQRTRSQSRNSSNKNFPFTRVSTNTISNNNNNNNNNQYQQQYAAAAAPISLSPPPRQPLNVVANNNNRSGSVLKGFVQDKKGSVVVRKKSPVIVAPGTQQQQQVAISLRQYHQKQFISQFI